MKKSFSNPTGITALLHNPRRVLRIALIVVGYLVVFIILDLITKQYEGLPGIVTWYPPAGLTYTLLLTFGIGFTPAVTIALLSDSMLIYRMPQPPIMLFLWALIIALIYGGGAAFLRKRIQSDWQLLKVRNVTWFIFTTVLVSALLAVLSVMSSALSGGVPRTEILLAIFHWWVGETIGVLTVTPFLLVFVIPGLKRFVNGELVKSHPRRSFPHLALSSIGQMASIVLTLYWVFIAQVSAQFRPLFLIILPLIWIALQRGFKGVTVAILVLNSGIVLTLGLFRFDLSRLDELQLTMIINCIVCLLLGAVITERKLNEEQIQILSKIPIESPNPIMRAKIEGILLYANPTSSVLLSNWKMKVGQGFPNKLQKKIKEVFNSGNYQEIEVQCREKTYSIILAPIVDAGYVNLYGRDITQRKQAEETNQRQLADLELLYENSLDINKMLKLDEIGSKVIEAINKKGLSWRHIAVHLYDPETQQVELLAHHYPGIRVEELQAEKQRVSKLVSNPNEGFVGWVIHHGELVSCGNVTEDTRYIMAYPDLRSGIYVPMKAGGRVIGAISVESEQEDAFMKADEHLLETLASQASVAIDNARLFSEINLSRLNLSLAYDATIEGWSKAVDFRDKETEGHSKRVTELTWRIARAYGMSQEALVNIRWGALLHDIGKMGVPDGILFKAASLTDIEWKIMKKHPTFAFEWLSPIKYLQTTLDIPYCHHEKWDGTGYPRGLKGELIPLAARIFAIVDVYDALTSDRPYRAAWTHETALKYIQEQSGKHFDPEVVKVFLNHPSI